jgi:hypothetical protein
VVEQVPKTSEGLLGNARADWKLTFLEIGASDDPARFEILATRFDAWTGEFGRDNIRGMSGDLVTEFCCGRLDKVSGWMGPNRESTTTEDSQLDTDKEGEDKRETGDNFEVTNEMGAEFDAEPKGAEVSLQAEVWAKTSGVEHAQSSRTDEDEELKEIFASETAEVPKEDRDDNDTSSMFEELMVVV